MPSYTTTLGEILEYPKPPAKVAGFLRRAQEAAEDPRVSENDLIDLIYGTENPLLEQGKFKGRGAVTKETLSSPLWPVFLDLLQHKRIALGLTSRERLEGLFTETVTEAARRARVTPDAIRKAVARQQIAALRKPGGHLLLDPRTVDTYIKGRIDKGFEKGPAVRLAIGNAPGQSFRVKFAGLRLGESGKLKDGKIRFAEVDAFERAALMITGKEMHRTFILEPSSRKHRYESGPFYLDGYFKFVEKINNATKASRAFRDFEPA